MAAKENTYGKLKKLCMKEDQIDKYIVHFEVLLTKADQQRTDKGAIDLFFNGLHPQV